MFGSVAAHGQRAIRRACWSITARDKREGDCQPRQRDFVRQVYGKLDQLTNEAGQATPRPWWKATAGGICAPKIAIPMIGCLGPRRKIQPGTSLASSSRSVRLRSEPEISVARINANQRCLAARKIVALRCRC